MLERLQSIALWLRPALPLAVAMGVAGAASFVWGASRAVAAEEDPYLIPGMLGMLWGALLFALITTFRSVPPPPDPADPWWARQRARLARSTSVLMAWAILAAAAAAAFVTFKLLGLWFG